MNLPLLNPDNTSEFNMRLSKVRANLEIQESDAILIGSTTNLFYITGGVFKGYIYLPIDREPVIFMIPPSTYKGDNVREIHKPEQIVEVLSAMGYPMPRALGLEMSDMYYNDIIRLVRLFPEAKLSDGSVSMRRARAIKTDYEIAMMRKDGMLQASVYSKIKHCYSVDMTDLEFQIEIERILRREGCLGYLRAAGPRMELNMGSLLAGSNADVPSPYDFSMGGAGIDPSLPVGASGKIMKPGMSVMIDMNGGFNGYQTDMTRVWTVGDIPEPAVKAHECSIQILRDLEKFALPGIEIGEMYRRARRLADDAGFADYFMGHSYKVKFIGHGVGIELNEMPVIMERNREPLLKNMTIAIEPKFVFPETGAVGVENTYVVTDDGLENLTRLNEELQSL